MCFGFFGVVLGEVLNDLMSLKADDGISQGLHGLCSETGGTLRLLSSYCSSIPYVGTHFSKCELQAKACSQHGQTGRLPCVSVRGRSM